MAPAGLRAIEWRRWSYMPLAACEIWIQIHAASQGSAPAAPARQKAPTLQRRFSLSCCSEALFCLSYILVTCRRVRVRAEAPAPSSASSYSSYRLMALRDASLPCSCTKYSCGRNKKWFGVLFSR